MLDFQRDTPDVYNSCRKPFVVTSLYPSTELVTHLLNPSNPRTIRVIHLKGSGSLNHLNFGLNTDKWKFNSSFAI